MGQYWREDEIEEPFDGAQVKNWLYNEVFEDAMESESAGEPIGNPQQLAKRAANLYIDNKIYPTKAAGKEACSGHESYAFRYYREEKGFESTPEPTEIKELAEKIQKEKEKMRAYFIAHNARNRKSQYIGCMKCGSKINRNYIPQNNKCPVCKHPFFSDTDMKTLQSYNNRLVKWAGMLAKKQEKWKQQDVIKKQVWYVSTTY